MRSSPEPLFTTGFEPGTAPRSGPMLAVAIVLSGAVTVGTGILTRTMAEASQLPGIASEIDRISGGFCGEALRLFGAVLFVGVFCAGAGGLVS